MKKKLGLLLAGLLTSGIMAAHAADKPDAKKLSDVETLKLQVAQKDLVIAQLQQQVLQLSAQVLQDKSSEAQSKMAAAKEEIAKAHEGSLVQFKPDGEPFLVDNPLKKAALLPSTPAVPKK
jgi:hypothetical protein